MWSKVLRFISDHKLLNNNGLYIVALSGGADSVALLTLLASHGYRLHVAHCNFHLRGSESDRDEAFCVDLCQRLDIPLHRAHFDTLSYAQLHKVSVEMAARELRYRWFYQLCTDIKADGICVAHHRDDSVETVLLNLLRGTGLRGLTGIQPRNGLLLRPLLCVSRADIENYLAEHKQSYVTDSTNLEDDALRNKLRLHVLPLLKTLNPDIVACIQHTAENVAEAQKMLDVIMERFKKVNTLRLSELTKYGSSEYIIFEWLKSYGFNGTQVRQLLRSQTGSIFCSPLGYDVLKDRERLVVEPSLKPMEMFKVPEIGTYILPDDALSAAPTGMPTGNILRIHIRKTCNLQVSKQPFVATIDAAKVYFPLTLRRVKHGDVMMPFGMNGHQLLSDLMTDRKMSLFDKRRQWVMTDAHGRIVWAVGLRVSQSVAITADTREVLELRFSVE